MPRAKANEEQGADPRTNKMEAVRRAMNSLGFDASPLEIQKHVKDNFGQEMDANMISSYKSTLRKKAGMKGRRRKKRGRPRKEEMAGAVASTAGSHDAVSWKDLRAIKDIAGRIGKKGLREILELLD